MRLKGCLQVIGLGVILVFVAAIIVSAVGGGKSGSSASSVPVTGPLPSRAVACARFQAYVANYPYSKVGDPSNATSPAGEAGARSAYYMLFHTLQRSCPGEAKRHGQDGDAGTPSCQAPQDNIGDCQAFNDPNFPPDSTRALVSLAASR